MKRVRLSKPQQLPTVRATRPPRPRSKRVPNAPGPPAAGVVRSYRIAPLCRHAGHERTEAVMQPLPVPMPAPPHPSGPAVMAGNGTDILEVLVQALVFNAAVAAVILGSVLYTHVRLHWLSGQTAAATPGCKSASGAAALDGSLLEGIQQLRYQQRLLQSEQDAMLDTVWSQVRSGPPRLHFTSSNNGWHMAKNAVGHLCDCAGRPPFLHHIRCCTGYSGSLIVVTHALAMAGLCVSQVQQANSACFPRHL